MLCIRTVVHQSERLSLVPNACWELGIESFGGSVQIHVDPEQGSAAIPGCA